MEDYDQAALEYAQTLTWEDYMESTSQSMQRDITIDALGEVRRRQGGISYFSELLIQWRREGEFGRVVPDNMVVVSDEDPIRRRLSFGWELELQSGSPLIVFEYVSTNSRKDYEDSFRKYERELAIPYYLNFDPDRHQLDLYHLVGPTLSTD